MPIGAGTILIVDDDPAVAVLLRALLAPDGWRIDDAAGGEEALGRLRAGTFDIVLTDIVMPGMDGLALLDRIQREWPGQKVVVMTAVNTPAHVVESIRGRAYSYLAKPFTREAVTSALGEALEAEMEPDDIVVLSARPEWVSMEARCRMSAADRLTQFMRELSGGLETEDRETISTAFRELLMNAIEHGGHSDPRKKVNLTFVRGARCLIYYIRDPGEGFSFERLPHAAVSNDPAQPFEHVEVRNRLGLRPGGLGILLTRKIADEVIYSEKGNEVLLIKYLG